MILPELRNRQTAKALLLKLFYWNNSSKTEECGAKDDEPANNDEPERKRQRQSRSEENSGNKVFLTPKIPKMQHVVPFDLIIEILKRLPVKSLLRFKCASKLWLETIEERNFIDKHRARGSQVEVYEEDRKTFIFKRSNHGLVLEKSTLNDEYYHLRNPSTKQILHLPRPPDEVCSNMSIIYLPTVDKYKLAYVGYKEDTQSPVCRVLTAGTDLDWRSVDIPSSTKLQDSAINWIATKNIADVLFVFRCGYSEIVCIEMENECITTVEIPHALFSDWEEVKAFRWNDKFSLARVEGEKLNFWILENYKQQKWAERKQVISLDILRKHPNSAEFMRDYPDMRTLWFHELKRNRLWIFVDDDISISYHFRNKLVCMHSPPPGKKVYCYYTPSLVHIRGMQREEIDKEDINIVS